MSEGRLAILSGSGALPALLARVVPDALLVTFRGVSHCHDAPTRVHRFEQLGALMADLHAHGIGRVVMAGGIDRPAVDPSAFDAYTSSRLDQLLQHAARGDDAILRYLVGLLEDEGFAVIGADELLEDLVLPPGLWAGPPPDAVALADIDRGRAIHAALAPLDIGQAVVVAGGLCLGIETLQGTDALLDFVAATPPRRRPAAPGVLVKAAKAGQERRVDLPAIGPETVRRAAAAGLAGLAIEAGGALVLDQDATRAELLERGLFLLALEPGAEAPAAAGEAGR